MDQEQRERLGRVVREAWIEWAQRQPNPKPSWLVPWEGLSEPDREADRLIGERVAQRQQAPLEDLEARLKQSEAARHAAEFERDRAREERDEFRAALNDSAKENVSLLRDNKTCAGVANSRKLSGIEALLDQIVALVVSGNPTCKHCGIARDSATKPAPAPNASWYCPARCVPKALGVHADSCWFAHPELTPMPGDIWEDAEDGERVRLASPTEVADLWSVEIIHGPAWVRVGATVRRSIRSPRWRRVSP